jgi:aminoglycoside 3-N-acetyltransferase
MSEAEIIKKTTGPPATINSLIRDFRNLGVKPGMTLMLHSSLSAVGWIVGGPVAIILALEEILGSQGTLVMPTHSGDLSDPADWSNPSVPEDWKDTIRKTMPAYDKNLTPTRGVGAVPEIFRGQHGVLRSDHPQVSFAAWGKNSQEITSSHTLDFGLGDGSPLSKIYDLEGWILLLGVGHEANTSLHLAEFRANFQGKKELKQGAPINLKGVRRWIDLRDFEEHSEKFPEIGSAYREAGRPLFKGKVGMADAVLIPQQDLVDFGVRWMEKTWNF